MKKIVIYFLIFLSILGFIFVRWATEKKVELERNREHEVSLVQTIKNSYRMIVEIQFKNPRYTEKPGGWDCEVGLTFDDGQYAEFKIDHALNMASNFNPVIVGNSKEEVKEKTDNLKLHNGWTRYKVRVKYSDGTVGEQ